MSKFRHTDYIHTKPCVLYIPPTNLYPYLCMYRSKGILKNRTQIEEWIEDKAIRRRWQHSRHRDGADSEEEEESSSDDSGQQEETTKEKASTKNKKNDLKPFVYPLQFWFKMELVSSEWREAVGTLHPQVCVQVVAVAVSNQMWR